KTAAVTPAPTPTPTPPPAPAPAPPPIVEPAPVPAPAPAKVVEAPKKKPEPKIEKVEKPAPPKAVAKAKVVEKAPPPVEKPAPPPRPSKEDQPIDPYGQPQPTTAAAGSTPPTPTTPTTEDAQAEGYVKMGRLFLQRQDYAKAAAAFNRAREHDPRNADAIAGLGQIAYHQGKYEDASVHFREAVRLASQRASFHVWLGHSLLGAGHPRDAE